MAREMLKAMPRPPPEMNISLEGDDLGGCVRTGVDTFMTAAHVLEEVCCVAGADFIIDLAGRPTLCIMDKFDADADLAHFYVTDPAAIQCRSFDIAIMVRDMTGYVPLATGNVPLKLRYFKGDYFVCNDNPLAAGCSGLPFITSEGVAAIYVGCQPGRIGVFRAMPFDFAASIRKITAGIPSISYEQHGRKGKNRLLRRARLNDFTDEAYDAAVARSIARLGHVDSRVVWDELMIERDFHQQWESENQSLYSDHSRYSDYDDYYFDDDFAAESGRFDENDRADRDRRDRRDWITGDDYDRVGYYPHSGKRTTVRLGDVVHPGPSDFLDGIFGSFTPPAPSTETPSTFEPLPAPQVEAPVCLEEEKQPEAPPAVTLVSPDVSELEKQLRAIQAQLDAARASPATPDPSQAPVALPTSGPSPSAPPSTPIVPDGAQLSKVDIARAVLAAGVSHKDMAAIRRAEAAKECLAEIQAMNAKGYYVDKVIELDPHVRLGKSREDIELLILQKQLKYLQSKEKYFEGKRREKELEAAKMKRIQDLLNTKNAEVEAIRRQMEELKAKSASKADF